VATEARFAALRRTEPERAAQLEALLQADADERWRYYSQLATIERSIPHPPPLPTIDAPGLVDLEEVEL
jgi:pyruvate-ferredoxin/flavodoxin oxidoreductase